MRNLILTIFGVLATRASSECTRSSLTALTDSLLAAQTAGHPTSLSLSPSALYTENRKPVPITSGILSKPLKVDHFRAQHDTTACAAFTELIVLNATAPYVIATQIRVDNSSKVSHIDTIWTTKGDWLFNVTGTYHWATQESWASILEVRKQLKRSCPRLLKRGM